MRDKILWTSFYIAVAFAFLGIIAVDSVSFVPAIVTLVSLIYITLFIVANSEEFET